MTGCQMTTMLAAVIISLLFVIIIVVLLALLYKKANKIKSVDNSLYVERNRNKILMKENQKIIDYFLAFAKELNKK